MTTTPRARSTDSQAGFSHVVIVAILVLALLCCLGYIFWQNFIRVAPSVNDEADKNDSTSQVVSKKQVACFALEKMCFDYPDNWKVNQSVKTEYEITSDHLEVVSESGFALYSNTGISGIGGTCLPEEAGTLEVVETKRLDVGYEVHEDRKSYEAPNLYAVKVVDGNNAGTEFQPRIFLTSDLSMTKKGVINGCDGMYASLFRTRHVSYDESPSNKTLMSFSETKAGSGSHTSMKSSEDAMNKLKSKDYVQAYDILSSVRYE